MDPSLNQLSSYRPLTLTISLMAQNQNVSNNPISELPKDNAIAFVKDFIQILSVSAPGNKLIGIDALLEKHGYKEQGLDVKSDNMTLLLKKLEDGVARAVVGDASQTKQSALARTLSAQLGDIRSEIRNQSLYSKNAAAPLTATATAMLREEAEFAELSTGTSYAEMWLRIAIFIGEVKDEYVDFYAELMQKYTEMYESFNENVQKASSDAISTGDDGNNVAFDTRKMQAGYNAFENDVNRLNNELGSVKGWNSMTDDQKKKEKLILEPAFSVDDRTGKISFNMSQYNTVSGTYPSGIKNGKVSTASYQAWLATFNSAGNAFQSNMQSFAQRYSQANNSFDTLNKILSSAISSTSDSARECIRAWG